MSSRMSEGGDPTNYELMGEFFDRRADIYEDHMREVIPDFDAFYSCVAAQIPETSADLQILDLGCGTGLELDFILSRAPNARVTAVDLSHQMLALLRAKYDKRRPRPNVTAIQGSYLMIDFPAGSFDYVVSVETMHHLTDDVKLRLYRNIVSWLRPGGVYIEGDYVVSPEEEQALRAEHAPSMDGTYHIDVPASVDTQQALLRQAGSIEVRVLFHQGAAAVFAACTPAP